jgi:chromosome segregation ATPase
MSPRAARRGLTALALWSAAGAGLLGVEWAQAQTTSPGPGGIYTCIDARGRKLTSDRPIPECLDREQTVRNSDGSMRGTLPPSYSPEERAAREEQRRKADAEDSARRDAQRRDRNLLARFPDAATHQQAREAALQQLQNAAKATEQRLLELEKERKKLADEAEFYVGRELPRPLKTRIDANRATVEAQRTAAANTEAERQRVNARYDEELAHLRKLWAAHPVAQASPSGAAPGR